MGQLQGARSALVRAVETWLAMLPDMPNLKRVQISVVVEKAEQTLEGKTYSFELVKEGQ